MNEKSIFDKKDTYQATIKKAKKKSLKRTILTSLAVTLTTLVALMVIFIAAYLHMEKTMNDYANLQRDEGIVQGANITLYRQTTSFGIDSVITQDQYIKNIDGIPFTWYNEQTYFKIYDKPTTLFDTTLTSFDKKQYYRNGQRVMNFLYPSIEVANDDLTYLTSLESTTKVEVAISFKEELSVDEMLEDFPTAQWAWVIDPLNRELIERGLQQGVTEDFGYIISEYAYGFSIQSEESIKDNVKEFKLALHRLSDKESNAKELLVTIQDSMKLGGIVVTGTVEEILPMMEQEKINYVSVGAIIPQ